MFRGLRSGVDNLLYLVVYLISTATAYADQTPSKAPPTIPKPPEFSPLQIRKTETGLTEFFTARTPYEFWLTVLTAVTGCFVIWLISFHVSKMRDVKPEDITRPAIVITIVMGSLILIIAGFSNEQIAAAFGLFGTIVGYMLGRMNASSAAAGLGEPTSNQKSETVDKSKTEGMAT